jgi:hypothetical protein
MKSEAKQKIQPRVLIIARHFIGARAATLGARRAKSSAKGLVQNNTTSTVENSANKADFKIGRCWGKKKWINGRRGE